MKNIFKNEKGMTMVSVIVGFAVLMCGSAIFYQAVLSSRNMLELAYKESYDLEKSVENYFNTRFCSSSPAGSSVEINFNRNGKNIKFNFEMVKVENTGDRTGHKFDFYYFK